MAVQFRAATGVSDEDSGPGPTVPRPTGTVDGDLMLAFVVQDADAPIQAGTIGVPTGWTSLAESFSPDASGRNRVMMKTAAAGDPASWQFTDLAPSTAGCDMKAGIISVFGHDPDAPIASGPTFQNSSAAGTTHTAPSVTGVVDGLLICGFMRSDSAGANATFGTYSGGLVERLDAFSTASSWVSLAIATGALTVAGATGTRTAVCSDSAQWRSASLVVAPAPAVTAVPASGFFF